MFLFSSLKLNQIKANFEKAVPSKIQISIDALFYVKVSTHFNYSYMSYHLAFCVKFSVQTI